MTVVTFYPQAAVDDSAGGNDTGIYINKGDVVTLTSSGTWKWGTVSNEYTGPEGDTSCIFGYCADTVDPTLPNFALLYRLGLAPSCNTPGAWSLAGTAITFTATTSGELYLIANDRCSYFYDNSGSLTTLISVLDHDNTECPCNYTGIDQEEF